MIAQPQIWAELCCIEHWYEAKLSGASFPPIIRGEIDRSGLTENNNSKKLLEIPRIYG